MPDFSLPQLTEEMERRTAPLRGLFPLQQHAVRPGRGFGVTLRAIRTSRRAGKSWALSSMLLAMGAKYPGKRPDNHFPYLMHTEDQCLSVAWPVVQELDEKYKIGCKFLISSLTVRIPGGGQIDFYGADQRGWIKTMRGQKNRVVVIDEAQDFLPDQLEYMVFTVFEPTLSDLRGLLVMAGTPGLIKAGPYYHVTCEAVLENGRRKYPDWELETWGTADNPNMAEAYQEMLTTLSRRHPDMDIRTIPKVRREWFGEWADDDEDSVYSFDWSRNGYFGKLPEGNWRYVVGVDFGWLDATAFSVLAYQEDEPALYVLESYSRSKMPLEEAVAQVRSYVEEYSGALFVADPARRQLLEELQTRADVPILPAEKQKKEDWIDIANADLLAGKVQILNPDKSQLAREMADLKWVLSPSGKKKEAPSLPNDCCDAFLYAFRYCYHYRYRQAPDKPLPGTPEYWDAEAALMRERAIARAKGDADRARRFGPRRFSR